MGKIVKALFLTAFFLLVLVWIVATIGHYLPKTHEVSKTIEIYQPVDSVWAALLDFKDYSSWRPNIERVEIVSQRAGHTVWREYDKHDQVLSFTTVHIDPKRKFVLESADRSRIIQGRWQIELMPISEGCLVTLTEFGEINSNIYRVVMHYIIGLDYNIVMYLEALKKYFNQ